MMNIRNEKAVDFVGELYAKSSYGRPYFVCRAEAAVSLPSVQLQSWACIVSCRRTSIPARQFRRLGQWNGRNMASLPQSRYLLIDTSTQYIFTTYMDTYIHTHIQTDLQIYILRTHIH